MRAANETEGGTSRSVVSAVDREKEEKLRRIVDSFTVAMGPRFSAELRRLVEEYPEYAEAWGHLGYYLLQTQRPEEAIPCYKRLLKLRPEDTEAYRYLGDSYFLLGQHRSARKAYLKLKGTPFYESPEVWTRASETEFPPWKILRNVPSILAMLPVRAVEIRFWRGLASELAGIRRSLPGIRAAGVTRYLGYLLRHYFREPLYRLPWTPCDLCGGRDFTAVFFYREQKKVRCDNCGLEFVERRPIDGGDAAGNVYEKDETIECFEKTWTNPLVLEIRTTRLASMFGEIGDRFPIVGGRAFEIGCGEGQLLKYLEQAGMEVEGIETAERLVQYCRTKVGLHVFRSTIRELNVAPEHYDLVLAYHVLEHLDKPSELFVKANRMLRRGGLLFIEVPVPDLGSLPLSDRLNGRLGYRSNSHMYYFRTGTVARYYEANGFEVVSTLTYKDESLPSGGFLGRKR
jgi:SAM-dependent methyltransferase